MIWKILGIFCCQFHSETYYLYCVKPNSITNINFIFGTHISHYHKNIHWTAMLKLFTSLDVRSLFPLIAFFFLKAFLIWNDEVMSESHYFLHKTNNGQKIQKSLFVTCSKIEWFVRNITRTAFNRDSTGKSENSLFQLRQLADLQVLRIFRPWKRINEWLSSNIQFKLDALSAKKLEISSIFRRYTGCPI